jgi:hypothetical protein
VAGTVYWVFSCLCGALLVFDVYRRPASKWVAADRNRGFWATAIVLMSLFGLGPVIGVVYLVALVPRLSRDDGYASGGFEKRY